MLWAAILAASVLSDGAAAAQDRATLPPADWPFTYYTTTQRIEDPDQQRSAAVGLRLVMASLAPQPVLEECLPVEVTPTLSRWDMRRLGFRAEDWATLTAADPYRTTPYPLVSRADWILLQLADANENLAYYRLALGGVVPKTRDEALKLLGVTTTRQLTFGMVEGDSGVSVQRVRLLTNFPILRGYAWGTKDVLSLEAHKDPLEQLEGDFQHDGEEWIIGRQKISTGARVRGALQWYFLSDGAGKIVHKAPVNLVEDHSRFRGLAEIRTPGSCIQCHKQGINAPTLNAFVKEIEAGVDRYAKPKDQAFLEQFHLGDLQTEIRRNNDDFGAIVALACGCDAQEAGSRFTAAIARYDEPLNLERAARELYTTPENLRQALALSSGAGSKFTARIAGLAHGQVIPREAFEEAWFAIWQELKRWEPKK